MLVALAGCGFGGDSASIERGELDRLVLQPGDLPTVFVRFDHGRQITADSPGGRRADRSRFGRIEGWKARYRRSGTPRTTGPLVVASSADLFDSSEGAERDFGAARMDLRDSASGWKPTDDPRIGDESFAATLVQAGRVRHYRVFWRDDNATATLDVNGHEGNVTLDHVLELARKQQRSIARAAASGAG